MKNQIHFSTLIKTWGKYFFRIFGVVFVLGFIASNIFQPNFWSLKQANAEVPGTGPGLGITFDANYSSPLGAAISNDVGSPFSSGQVVDAQFAVYHCNSVSPSEEACVGGVSGFDGTLVPVQAISVTAPTQGTTSRTSYSVPSFSCGRVQVDIGLPNGGGILGGKVYNSSQDCSTPVTGTANLSSSCANNTPTLSANWSAGSGSNCNVYVQAGSTANQLSSQCTGSTSITSLSQSVRL